MKVELQEHICIITREDGDPKFYNSGWALADSVFMHHVKLELIKQGFDVIKKRMCKDGHMVSDEQQYIRDREWDFCIYDHQYAIRSSAEDFNNDGIVELKVER